MADFTRYITKNGDRWDLIAWRAYGDVSKQKELMDANPDVCLVSIFQDGTTLILPIIPEVNTQSSLLPPWKQSVIVTEENPDILTTQRADATIKKAPGGGLGFGDTEFFDYNFDFITG